MSLRNLSQEMLPAVEAEMQKVVNQVTGAEYALLRHMLAYHLGWEEQDGKPFMGSAGKRIRPLLVLLSCAAAGGEWRSALPAAAAVELLHNFSLIHDDIEDRSPLRRGRPTLWTLWGIPQATNAGDAMFSQAHLALISLESSAGPLPAFEALKILDATCLHLTQGQFLDISFESRTQVSIEEYWQMIGGKTAALLAACLELGALVGKATPEQRHSYRLFGEKLGLAFQVQDDLLGIWGDSQLTGKSAESDLVEGKKSLPVLYGLAQGGNFQQRWMQGPITVPDVTAVAAQLAAEGAREYTQEVAARLTAEARIALAAAHPQGLAGAALQELAESLLNRKA